MSTVLENEAPTGPVAVVEAPAPPAPDTRTSAPEIGGPRDEGPVRILRPAVAAALTAVGAAFLLGGLFDGATPKVLACLAAIVGAGSAAMAARATRRVTAVQALSLAIVGAAGLVALALVDVGAVGKATKLMNEAIRSGRLRRPPAPFEPGWRPLLVWACALVGYSGTFLGTVLRRPVAGLLLPVPVMAFAAIAQPPETEVVGGLLALVTFVAAMAVAHRPDRGEGPRVGTSFEMKRALRTLPIVAGLVGLLLAANQLNLLFPDPVYDPAQKAQLPKAVPLTEVKDRVLFRVKSSFPGPWRTGVLDVYDGRSWRLPPYSASDFTTPPADGIINPAIAPNQKAQITIMGLDGTVLPAPARTHAIVTEQGRNLVYDPRTETFRVKFGQVKRGYTYDVAMANPPTTADLGPPPAPRPELATYTDVPPAPPAIARRLDAAGPGPLERFLAVRKEILDVVAAKGAGLPVPVPPEKVVDMLDGSKEGSPFEITAGLALVARWAGLPSRLGYGFDGGEVVAGEAPEPGAAAEGAAATEQIRELRPKHGSTWLELYYDGQGWFPVLGLPKRAKRSIAKNQVTLQRDVEPSEEIATQLFVPVPVPPRDVFFQRVQVIASYAFPLAALAALAWVLWPAWTKWRRRSRQRAWAAAHGPDARIAVAYAEFRDLATDLGAGDADSTPLAFLSRVVDDPEHAQLAWLVTRTLWGDLRDAITERHVLAAEELSRSLRRRLMEAQPMSIKAIAMISRLSLRHPYAPELHAHREMSRAA